MLCLALLLAPCSILVRCPGLFDVDVDVNILFQPFTDVLAV